jgi:hypothetical protein
MAVLFTLIADNPKRGIVGKETIVDPTKTADFAIEWDVDVQGVPGAIIVKNNYWRARFYLKNITIHIPKWGDIVFLCNSWVYKHSYYNYDRVFFANHVSVCLYLYIFIFYYSMCISYIYMDAYIYLLSDAPLYIYRRTCPARCRRRSSLSATTSSGN